MINVTQGNPVPLRIQLEKGGVVFDLSDSSDIAVTIVGAKVSKRHDEPVVVDGSINVTVPATMGTGFYGIEIKGTRFNKPWRTKYARVLELTDITTLSNNGKVKYIGEGDFFDIVMTVDLFDSGSSADLLEELERLRGEVTSLTGELAEKDTVIAQKDEVISGKDAVIAQKDAVISGKDEVISGLEGDLQDSQQQLSDMTDERDKATLFIGSYLGGGADIEVPGRGELNIRYGTLEVLAGIAEIGDNAFRLRDNVINIDLGGVEIISNYAFRESTIQSVRGENVTVLLEAVFYNCKNLTDVYLPNLRTTNGTNSQFGGCSVLESVNLPSLTSCNQSIFSGCSKLKNVHLPSLASMGNATFQNCTELEEISLPSLTAISYNCFLNCNKLRKVDFTDLGSLGVNINYSNLETIILRKNSLIQLSNTSYINNTCTVYVPDELVDEYKDANNWRNHGGQIKGMSEYVE